MSLLQALILGVVQGATEFLPVSSSGHLVLVPWVLGWSFEPKSAFVFDVLVQWGTLAAVVHCYRRDLLRLARGFLIGLARRDLTQPDARLAWLILLASLPAAAAGLLFKGIVERAFDSPSAATGFLLVTSALLALGEVLRRRQAPTARGSVSIPLEQPGQNQPAEAGREQHPGRALHALHSSSVLVVGLAQALALLPGISRSGATIAAGLSLRMARIEAAKFSFLMAVPIMFGAGVVALRDLLMTPEVIPQVPSLAVGFLASAVTGALAIRWLMQFLARRSLAVFSIYCAVAGAAGLILSVIRG